MSGVPLSSSQVGHLLSNAGRGRENEISRLKKNIIKNQEEAPLSHFLRHLSYKKKTFRPSHGRGPTFFCKRSPKGMDSRNPGGTGRPRRSSSPFCRCNPRDKSVLYKTERCREGWGNPRACRYGKKCMFAHTESQLREREYCPHYRQVPCVNFERDGVCDYGSRCRFIHRAAPVAEDPEPLSPPPPSLPPPPLQEAPRIPLGKIDPDMDAAAIWTAWVNKAKTPPGPCETRQLNHWISE